MYLNSTKDILLSQFWTFSEYFFSAGRFSKLAGNHCIIRITKFIFDLIGKRITSGIAFRRQILDRIVRIEGRNPVRRLGVNQRIYIVLLKSSLANTLIFVSSLMYVVTLSLVAIGVVELEATVPRNTGPTLLPS